MITNKKERLSREMEESKFYECIELDRAKVESKNKYRTLTRYMQIQRKQIEDADRVEKVKQAAAVKETEVKNEEKLAQEMDRLKKEEIKDLCIRQSLRQNSPELRELESQLRAAYVNKQLMTQLAEKKALKLEEKLREKKALEVLAAARIQDAEFMKKQVETDIKQKAEYKQALQDQMILQEKTKRYLYEEFLREKKMIDDIIQRIHAEDERFIQEKMCKMLKTKEEMLAFKEAQAIWKEKRRVALIEEDRRINEYLQEKAREEHMKKVKSYEDSVMKEKLSDDLARELYTARLERSKRDYLREQLIEKEFEEALEKRHRDDMEAQIRRQLDQRQVLDRQLAENEEKLENERKEDALYKEQLLAKLVEDQRLDQMSAQKKRMKMLQLRRDAQEMMKERRRKKAEDMQERIALLEEEKRETERRGQIIEEERLKMLKEHAKNLIGYLPRGVLREDDLPHLGCDIMKEYKKK